MYKPAFLLKKLSYFYLWIIFQSFPLLVYPQDNYKFTQLNIDQGLLGDKVFSLAEDTSGYLWVGTYLGLSRYDGWEFENFIYHHHDSTSIASGFVRTILIDPFNKVWTLMSSGVLSRYDPVTEKFSTYTLTINDRFVSIRSIQMDDTTIYIGTMNGGLYQLDVTEKVFNSIEIPQFENSSIHGIAIRKNKTLLLDIGESGVILEFNPKTLDTEKIVYAIGREDAETVYYGKVLFEDSNEVIWIGTIGNGLYRIEGDNIQNFSQDEGTLPGNIISHFTEGKPGEVWASIDGGGIAIFKNGHKKPIILSSKLDDKYSLSANNVLSLHTDKNGIIWVGTFGGGLNYYDPQKYKFEHFEKTNDPNSISSNKILSFLEDSQGNIWVGTDGDGLNKITPDGKVTIYKYNPDNPNSISGDVVVGLHEDKFKNIWITTYSNGITILNPREKIFERFNKNTKGNLIYDNVWPIMNDRDGDLWIGIENGQFGRYNYLTEKFSYVRNISTQAPLNELSSYIMQDSKGNIWATISGNGLWKIDKEHFTIEKVDIGEYNRATITYMMEDSRGILWAGSEGYGLLKFSLTNSLTVSEAISYNPLGENKAISIRGILEDNSHFLWLSSNNGLYKFDFINNNYISYKKEDGLQSNQFSYSSLLKHSSGKFYFGGTNGFNTFFPDSIAVQQFNNQPVLKRFYINNELIYPSDHGTIEQSIEFTKEITLNHNESSFAIDFSTIDLRHNQQTTFCYKLEGFDKDWIQKTTQRSVNYTHLNSGTYTFLVALSDNEGCLTESQLSLNITILSPWWETLWFRLFIVTLIISLIYSLFLYRIQVIKERSLNLKKIVDLRTRELQTANSNLLEKTERLQEAQNQLVTNEKMASLGHLMAGIAHEINNPMNFIRGGAYALKENIEEVANNKISLSDNTEKQFAFSEKQLVLFTKIIKNINNGVTRVTEILEGLRVFTRSKEDEMIFVDLHENINATLIVLRNSYKDYINIIKDYKKIPNVRCNPGKMNQVFSNILSNAIYAVSEKYKDQKGGHIIIYTSLNQSEDRIVIKIANNGPLIPDEEIKSIFEPFYTTKPQGEGTGLGLPMTFSIIMDHGGSIDVKNEKIILDETATIHTVFEISLPIK